MKKRNLFILFLIIIILLVILFHQSVLQEMANFLIVKDNEAKSDVIIVLGGEVDGERTEKAVQLYKAGYAPRLLFSDGTDLSWRVKSMDEMIALAKKLQVPVTAILKEEQSRSTFENAFYTKKIMLDHHWTSAIVVTSVWHTRRSKFIFDKVYAGTGIHFTYAGAADKRYKNYIGWWKDSEKQQVILTEWAKLVVYWLKY